MRFSYSLARGLRGDPGIGEVSFDFRALRVVENHTFSLGGSTSGTPIQA